LPETKAKHYKLFVQEVRYWVDIFGLRDFEIYTEHDDTQKDARACVYVNLEGMMATIELQKDWDCEVDDDMIRKVAFHEVMETMLAPLWVSASERYATPESIEMAKHGIIRRLENCVWKPDWEARQKKAKRTKKKGVHKKLTGGRGE
jgi:hypothetical protein